jgi:hypothetical protein
MKKKCLWCNTREVSLFGKYDEDSNTCEECLNESYAKGSEPVPGQAMRERSYFADDIVQPMKKDGTINKKYIQAHGTKALEKELKVSKKQIMDNVEKYG